MYRNIKLNKEINIIKIHIRAGKRRMPPELIQIVLKPKASDGCWRYIQELRVLIY